jgi:hypothetical protein
MHTFILADWSTVSGMGGDSITQEDIHYLDLEPFQDVVFYVECREATTSSSAPVLALQTAPTKDESMFSQIGATVSLTASTAPTTVSVLLATASLPLARYVRWKITGPASGGWDASFRVIVTANSPGM